jgi:hypothetical protein
VRVGELVAEPEFFIDPRDGTARAFSIQLSGVTGRPLMAGL